MDYKKIAEELFGDVERQGMSTDNCYSRTFKQDCKQMAINRAQRIYSDSDFQEIKQEIKNL